MSQQSRYYDRHQRDAKSKQFYNSAEWLRCRAIKLAATPWCERCGRMAELVHHKKPIATPEGWEDRSNQDNLASACDSCHQAMERDGREPEIPAAAGILEPHEDEQFYFDAEAADRPIRFIEKYCRHHEGRWAGRLLELIDWQALLIRTLYGWKHRAGERQGLRRFQNVFLLSAKGAGKTPLMAAVGMYEMFSGGEAAAHVVSMATDLPQARLTQDWAKEAIKQDPKLSARCQITNPEICGPKASSWETISGTFGGRAGFRPSCILADEAWEWPNGKCFESITANKFKRQQPIVWVSTNAGDSRESYCWGLYQEAKKVLAGLSKRTDLLPAIFEAPEHLDWKSEEAHRAACPSIPEVVSFESLRPLIVAAEASPHKEAEHKRLHLSHWCKGGAKRWLDMALWDACVALPIADCGLRTENRAAPPESAIRNPQSAIAPDAALYVGFDLSLCDDLCSVIFLWVTADKFWAENLNWIPRQTAEQYQARNLGRYDEWSRRGDITLLDELTITPAVRRAIAQAIIDRAAAGGWTIRKACYDRYKADDAVDALKAAGVECEPIAQGFGVSSGCAELERRLKEKSIVLPANAVMRVAAENVEVKQDGRGNFWPVKPNAKDNYAGTRSIKIDPIAALVSVLVEARKHTFAAHEKEWAGGVWVV